MRWEERLLAMFDDLELQAEGLALAERDAEVAELARSEYAEVDLTARLHASVGGRLTVTLRGVGTVQGDLLRVGADWFLLASTAQEWMVRVAALRAARGVAGGAIAAPARPVTARLGIGSALRRVADAGGEVTVLGQDGSGTSGRLRRVGADFVELAGSGPGATTELVPFAAMAAVRRG
jgi:hypothetical protein